MCKIEDVRSYNILWFMVQNKSIFDEFFTFSPFNDLTITTCAHIIHCPIYTHIGIKYEGYSGYVYYFMTQNMSVFENSGQTHNLTFDLFTFEYKDKYRHM